MQPASREPRHAAYRRPRHAAPEDLGMQLHLQLHTQLSEDLLYQPQFLPKNRAGEPQNLSETLLNYFSFSLQLEMKNIIKQINFNATHINFKTS